MDTDLGTDYIFFSLTLLPAGLATFHPRYSQGEDLIALRLGRVDSKDTANITGKELKLFLLYIKLVQR